MNFNIFKRKPKQNKTRINTAYINAVPSNLPYSQVKNALNAESLSEVIACFEHFKRFDTQISSELNKRKSQLLRLPLIVESSDTKQQEFLEKLINSRHFRQFLYECGSAIAYGFSSFVLNFENINGVIYPKADFISHRYFESDENFTPYLSQGSARIYLDSKDLWTYYHPSDSGNIIEQSLMYKIICIASLKHVATMKYMTYLDAFSVPPIAIKSDSLSNEEMARSLLNSVLDLRSSSVGLFAKDDMIEVLNGNVDKGTFLDFIRYCDESISKVITGQVLAGNSTQNGTQALGNIHDGIQKAITEFDAKLLGEGVESLLKKVLEYNFATPSDFSFIIDTNTEKDEKLQADTYLILSQMGVKIPLSHLEQTFKIQGLEYQTEAQGGVQSVAFNKATQMLNLPLDNFDKEFNKASIQSSFNIDKFLENATSFEEVQERLQNALKGKELELAEDELAKLIANSVILGEQV